MASAAGSVPAPVAGAARRQQRATSAHHLSRGGRAANASPLRCLFMLALLCVLAPNAHGANPTATHIIPMFVSSVSPAEGSIFGGSRLFVNGSGFETNHHVGGNIVKVGRKVSFKNLPTPAAAPHPTPATSRARTRHPVARSMPACMLAYTQPTPMNGRVCFFESACPIQNQRDRRRVPFGGGARERGASECATGCLPALPSLPSPSHPFPH